MPVPPRDSRDGESPLLLLSSRAGLTRAYGPEGFREVDSALQRLRNGLDRGGAWLVYVDDEASLAPFHARSVNPHDPRAVRGLIESLEIRLGAGPALVWIIGSHRVVPHFELPNPADDPDPQIPSDAPYCCRGDDWYRPHRVVSRLPNDGAARVCTFTAMIRRLAATGGPRTLPADRPCAFGYSASVWRQAAQDVFSVLDSEAALRLSPPWEWPDYHRLSTPGASVRYYNLHGKPDGREWHGQLDPSFAAYYPDFPVALRQVDIASQEAFGSLIVTESCYGATFGPAGIAGRYLRMGASALLGSTAMSYGALSSPVTGADLLVREFLRYVRAGTPVGRAFLLAKLAFARAMMDGQGFLDAEDQKTLLSFTLVGDPSLQLQFPRAAAAPPPPDAARLLENPAEVICARAIPDAPTAPVRAGLLRELEEAAAALLATPGCRERGSRQGTCRSIAQCRRSQLTGGNGLVLSLSRELPTGGTAMVKYTITGGRVTKTMISR